MFKLKPSRPTHHHPRPTITPGPDIPWDPVGPAQVHLLEALEQLYWTGVESELQNIVDTLQTWNEPHFSRVDVAHEYDHRVHGFDTFVDQVSEDARRFAAQYNHSKTSSSPEDPTDVGYVDALEKVIRNTQAERTSSRIRAEIREHLDAQPKWSRAHQRVWTLLQATGFLDIDKVIEHRPLPEASLQTIVPQMKYAGLDDAGRPTFTAQECTQCKQPIRGNMFVKTPDCRFCDDCYWAHYYGDPSFTKQHKHSLVHRMLDCDTINSLCPCPDVARLDADGQTRTLLPLDPGDDHRPQTCQLLQLDESLARAKQQQLPAKPDKSASLLRRIRSRSLQTDDDSNIPSFFRQQPEKPKPGSGHMALRIGPLIIENGVAHTKSGALITLRPPPIFHHRFVRHGAQPSLLVADDAPRRMLFQQARPMPPPTRYNAVLKQVVGAPFTGLLATTPEGALEQEIVQLLLAGDDNLAPILQRLRRLLQPRLLIYLHSVVERLAHPDTRLAWSPSTTPCDAFCASLLDTTLFAPLVHGGPAHQPPNLPLYLLSFTSPGCSTSPGSSSSAPPITSKYDIPPSWTESYLTQPSPIDLLDSLHHYWTDWGAFDPAPYARDRRAVHHLFPWDCTEAYARNPTRCRSAAGKARCNLAKHLWAFPWDAWSLGALHLLRDREVYPASMADTAPALQPYLWMRDRLTVLVANDRLVRAAAAMAASRRFCVAVAWIAGGTTGNDNINYHYHHRNNNNHNDKGINSSNKYSVFRSKTGGIHRAQPDPAGLLVDWALLAPAAQKQRYETLREVRVALPDIPAADGVQLPRVKTAERSRRQGTTTSASSGEKWFGGPRTPVSKRAAASSSWSFVPRGQTADSQLAVGSGGGGAEEENTSTSGMGTRQTGTSSTVGSEWLGGSWGGIGSGVRSAA